MQVKVKIDDTVAYRDPQTSVLHGVGIVVSVTESEYTILWALRGSKRYKRSILDQRLWEVFQVEGGRKDLPKEKRLRLGTTTNAVSFNENYNQEKVGLLCDTLKTSRARSAKHVVDGLAGLLVTKKVAQQAAAKATLKHLAELCSREKPSDASDAARQISQELFFGYVIQESDFDQPQ
jgi:hypothetical protein